MHNASMRVVALVAMLLTLAIPGRLWAQDTPNAAEEVKVEEANQDQFGNLISVLNDVSAQLGELEALNEVGEVRIVRADDLLEGADVEALNEAITQNKTEILGLQSALTGNEAISNSLTQNDVAASDVIAVQVLEGGDVVVYTTCTECAEIAAE